MDILQNNKPWTNIPGRLGISYWIKKVLVLYVFTMPFVSAFAFTGTISFPLIFAVILFGLMGLTIISSSRLPQGFVGYDLLILFFLLFWVLFSFAVNGWGVAKSFNHTIAYLFTFLFFYVAIKFSLFKIDNKNWVFKKVLQLITFVTILSALYANMEFISSNILGIDLNDYIPRPSEAEKSYRPTVVGLFFRARGFTPESGHFAFMMELFSPLALFYMYFSGFCNWPSLLKTFIVILIFFSFVFATSSASFIIIPLTVLFAILVHFKKVVIYIKKRIVASVVTIGIASSFIFLLNYYFSFSTLMLLSLTDKAGSSSFDDRQERLDFFYDKFFHFDFSRQLSGAGPAGFEILGYDESKAIISLYYSIPFELGYLGLLLLSMFFLYIFWHALKNKTAIGFFLLISVASGIIHYYFIANFWYPWFWFIGAFSVFCSKKISNE